MKPLGPTAQPVDDDAWRVWQARCAEAAQVGKLITDTLTRDDYPGSTEWWQWIVKADDRIRHLRANSPVVDNLEDPSPRRSVVPDWCRRSLDDLDATDAVNQAASWWADWMGGATKTGLHIAGDVGSGKTSIAAALAVDCGEPNTATFVTTRGLAADQLEHRRDHQAGQTPVEKALQKPVLVVDDLGAEAGWATGVDIVADLLLRRYDRQQQRDVGGRSWALIVTTNLSWDELEALYGHRDGRQGKRITDRLRSLCEPMQVTGGSRREAA